MMPTRMIRDGWLESERIDRLSPQAEAFFLRLILRADDFGRYTAHPRLMASGLYPLRLVTDEEIRGLVAECKRAGLVALYAVDGKQFLEVPRYDQRLRAKRSRFPAPASGSPANDGHVTGMCQADDGHVSGTGRPESESESEIESEEKPNTDSSERCAKPHHSKPKKQHPIPVVSPDQIAEEIACLGGLYPVDLSTVAEWERAFPAVDVAQTLREIRAWATANPAKRKTPGGMMRFLTAWMAREQNKPDPVASGFQGRR